MEFVLRLAVAVPVIALLGVAGFQVSKAAFADSLSRQDSILALQRADGITPEDAEIHARIAVLDPSRDDELKEAIKLNPRQPSWLIMRSIRQEQDGDTAGAEHSLLQAVAVSRYFVPCWSLAAFYYRQNDTAKFVPAARQTLSVGGGDFRSIFQMARNLKVPESTIQNDILPKTVEIGDWYLHFALDENNLDAAAAAARELVAVGSKNNRGSVLTVSEALLLRERTADALQLWNRLVEAHWITEDALDPSSGRSLTDGLFRKERIQAAFDWKLVAPLTAPFTLVEPNGIRFEFTGRQPEYCELLSQYVPVVPKRQYRLVTRYRTQDIPNESGIRWVWFPIAGKSKTELSYLASEQSTEQNAAFETSPQSDAYRLALVYSRLPGVTRLEGRLWIESLSLELLPAR
jgi:hypothetical protein